MELWSKGLGRLVLGIRLSDRGAMEAEGGDHIDISGNMGAPVYWDYAVRLEGEDVVDFLDFLKKPAVVRFLIHSEHRWSILATALGAAAFFTWGIVYRLVTGHAPTPQTREPTSTVPASEPEAIADVSLAEAIRAAEAAADEIEETE